MLWCSNYGFRGSTGYSFSIILSVSHFKPGLRYVGDITGFSKNVGTTISGMTANIRKAWTLNIDPLFFTHKPNRALIVVVGIENRL